MQKKLTITLDQEAYRRPCILLGSNDEDTCIRYIEKWAKNAGANCYEPGELDAMFRAEGQEAAFQARMYARNKAAFADSTLEGQFQDWLTEHYRASEEERQLENKFLDRLETGYKEEYDDPQMEADFRKWLVNGWLWIQDDDLQRQAEAWAKGVTTGIQTGLPEDDISDPG